MKNSVTSLISGHLRINLGFQFSFLFWKGPPNARSIQRAGLPMAWKPPWHIEGHSQGKNLKVPLEMQEGIEVGGLARHCCWPRQREKRIPGLHWRRESASIWLHVANCAALHLSLTASFPEFCWTFLQISGKQMSGNSCWYWVAGCRDDDHDGFHPQGPLSLVGVPRRLFLAH